MKRLTKRIIRSFTSLILSLAYFLRSSSPVTTRRYGERTGSWGSLYWPISELAVGGDLLRVYRARRVELLSEVGERDKKGKPAVSYVVTVPVALSSDWQRGAASEMVKKSIAVSSTLRKNFKTPSLQIRIFVTPWLCSLTFGWLSYFAVFLEKSEHWAIYQDFRWLFHVQIFSFLFLSLFLSIMFKITFNKLSFVNN